MDSRRPADRASSDTHGSRAGRRPAWRMPPSPAPPPITESPQWYARPLPWILGLVTLNVALLLGLGIALWLPGRGTPETAEESNRDEDEDVEIDLLTSIAGEFDLTIADDWPTSLGLPRDNPLTDWTPTVGEMLDAAPIPELPKRELNPVRPVVRRSEPFNRAHRRQRAEELGASKESEAAVELALKWLSEHQLSDGSWSFDHRDGGQCQGRCKDPGSMKAAKNGATGLALLAFLGAGESHIVGKYEITVAAGLRYLLSSMKDMGADGGSWYDNVGNATSYSHAIASMAMCEAYGMTRPPLGSNGIPRRPEQADADDITVEEREALAKARRHDAEDHSRRIRINEQRLKAAAQSSLTYIMNAQHSAGGWRYTPKTQPGDTSHHGWMILALKTGYMANLKINPFTVKQAGTFLDSVASGKHGSIYHYLPEKSRGENASRATTAIGLLCRMYLGMDPNSATIREGVARMTEWGPDLKGNMYYNYYATQVVFQYGGEPWKKWNSSMRDFLVARQSKDGHEKGSWSFKRGDSGASAGGRLYCTAMAAITLETYYANPRIYRNRAE